MARGQEINNCLAHPYELGGPIPVRFCELAFSEHRWPQKDQNYFSKPQQFSFLSLWEALTSDPLLAAAGANLKSLRCTDAVVTLEGALRDHTVLSVNTVSSDPSPMHRSLQHLYE